MGSLSSRERILKVLRHELPDRVPVTLFLAPQPSFVTTIHPDLPGMDALCENPAEAEWVYCRKIVEITRKLGADLVLRPIFYEPELYLCKVGLAPYSGPNWNVSITTQREGDNVVETMVVRTPKGELRQVNKKCYLTSKFYTQSKAEYPIKDERDLDLLIEYEPRPDEVLWERQVARLKPMQELAVENDGVNIPWVGCGPFNTASYLRRLEYLLMDPYTNPDFYHRYLAYCAERNLRYSLPTTAAEPDMIAMGGNVAGSDLVSKEYFDEFVLPYERRYVQGIQNTGVPVLYHNCGHIMTLLESYVDMGLAAVESFSPPPLADADIGEAKRRVGDSIILMGGINHKHLLEDSSPNEVQKVTRKVVEECKPGGMFILGQADYLEEKCKLENLEAMIETAIRYGKY
jgi:uroporphyrinogen decarboxylase